jgi:hypothetical protein
MIDPAIQAAWDGMHHHERASKRRCPDAGDTLWCGGIGPDGDSEPPLLCSDPGCMQCPTPAALARATPLDVECTECSYEHPSDAQCDVWIAGDELLEYPPDDVIEEWARTCRCCADCWSRPCDGCCAGGVCDAMPCRCHEEPSDWDAQEDEQ